LYVPQGKETFDFRLYKDADHELNPAWNFHCLPFKLAFGRLLRPSVPLPETSGAGPTQSGYFIREAIFQQKKRLFQKLP